MSMLARPTITVVVGMKYMPTAKLLMSPIKAARLRRESRRGAGFSARADTGAYDIRPMARTFAEKALARAAGVADARVGQMVDARPD